MVNGNPCSVIDSDTVRGIAFLVDKTPGERADGFHDARLITAGPKLFEALEKIGRSRHRAATSSGRGRRGPSRFNPLSSRRSLAAQALLA